MGGLEASPIDFNAEPEDTIVVIRDEPQPEGVSEEVFDIEQAKREPPFEILGRMAIVQQEIYKLRDSIPSLPENLIEKAREEMGFLVETYNQLDTLYKLKERGGTAEEYQKVA